MQSETPAVSQRTPFPDSPQADPLNTTQHGHDHCGDDHRVSGTLRRGETGDSAGVVPGSAPDEGDSPLNDSVFSCSIGNGRDKSSPLQSRVSFETFPNGL